MSDDGTKWWCVLNSNDNLFPTPIIKTDISENGIWYSNDSGNNWNKLQVNNMNMNKLWAGISINNDGTKICAVSYQMEGDNKDPGKIWLSTDSGNSFTTIISTSMTRLNSADNNTSIKWIGITMT